MQIYSTSVTSAWYSLSAKIHTKWIIGRTKWTLEYFSYLALVEYRTKWIRIKWGPGVIGKHLSQNKKAHYVIPLTLLSFIPSVLLSCLFVLGLVIGFEPWTLKSRVHCSPQDHPSLTCVIVIPSGLLSFLPY